MGTPLNTKAPTLPSLKLRNVGDHADCMIVDIEPVPRYKYRTEAQIAAGVPLEVMLGRNGKPQTQDKVTVMVIGGKGVIADNGTDRPPGEAEVATIFFGGRDRWDPDLDKTRDGDVGRSFSAAQDHVGGLQVGDVMRWKFEREVPGQGAEPRKVRTVLLRRHRPEEEPLWQRAETLRTELRSTSLSGGGGGGGNGRYEEFDPEEEPFLRDATVRDL